MYEEIIKDIEEAIRDSYRVGQESMVISADYDDGYEDLSDGIKKVLRKYKEKDNG